MKKAMSLCSLIVFLVMVFVSLFIGAISAAEAEEIVIDTEKGVPGFWTEPARDLPANWQYVQDHPDTSADGWFDTNAYPPGQGNGSFWYTISFPDMGECKGIWETSVPHTGKYEVFAWIPSPDHFDPYLDESTPPSDYLPTKRAQYKIYHNDGVATVSIDQNVNMGGFASLGVFVFDTTARVELSSNGVEFWRCVAFDAVKFVPVVNDMAVTDVSIIPPATSVGQSTTICVTITNEGSQQEDNVSVKAFVDGDQVGSTKCMSLDPESSDTMTFLWIPDAAKNYSVEGEVGVVSGETDTGDNRKAIEVGVLAMPAPAPIFDERKGDRRKSAHLTDAESYTFVTLWPELPQPWYFDKPYSVAVSSGYVYVADTANHRIQKFDSAGNSITKWGSPGTGDGEFDWPYGIVVDSSDNVYVADTGNQRIQKFDADGNFITKWGSPGTGDGEFDHPIGIAVDSSGYVLVADMHNHRIQKFDSDGNFVTKWGSPGTGDGEFGFPYDIAVDNSGYVFVCDSSFFERMQKFDSDGNFITKWGSRGTGDGEFRQPNGIAVDSSGYVYVADTMNNRIQKFDSEGNFITKWGSQGNGEGEFLHPCGIVVDSSGNVYVADSENNRIQKFAPGIPAHQPIANAGRPYSGNVNEDIQFYGKGTPAKGRTIVAYEWSFNGETVTEQDPTHTYSEAGTYIATLKVQDSAGLWSKPNECTVHVFEPFTFVQVTDVHIGCKFDDVIPRCKKDTERSIGWFTSVINGINKLAPEVDFVLVTGDLVEYGEPDFFYKFMDVLSSLDSSIRFYHIPGNHDRYTSYGRGDDLTEYHDCVLINGPRQILIGHDNYTFEYGGYTFIGLDSGADTGGIMFWGTGLTEPQINGLRAFPNLEAPKIIFMHHPVFNDYSVIGGFRIPNWGIIANNSEPFITYCQDNNVQLVLTDHTHEDKIFNADGKRVGWDSNDRPLFIQTASVTEHSECRVIEVNGYDDISIHPSTDQPICWKKRVWVDDIDEPVLQAYDSQGRHTGIDGSGNIVYEIPRSYYIGNYGTMNLEGIILYDDSEDYKLTVTLKDGSIVPKTKKLRQPENQSFNLTITNQTGDSLTTISYNNLTFTENTTATINLNRTAVNYTMALDYTGDNITDETKDPDSIETDYAPTATINTPVNNSVYRYGDQIVFNGTGIDIEDGILTNSSLVWTSTLDGFIGIGCECNATNLTAGTHIIELTVNDSSGQTDTDNVTLTVIAPDLAVTNIAFSNPQPIEGETVTINVTVHNNGTANAADVTVQFFDGTPTNGTQIGTDQTIAALNAGENKIVSVVWDTTGEAGDNCIWVVADPADTIKEPDEENNQANRNIFVGAPDVLHITQAQTDRAAYLGNEAVLISCIVQNASGNISANVSAEIAKPDSGTDNITMAEGIVGYYYGTFTNTSLSGRYNVTIYANRTGFVGDTESLCFEVLDTTPPASVTNITNTSGPTWINWAWDNPLDPDFDHTLIYLNGSWKTATAENGYLADGLNATTVYEIATRTVDAGGNINATWVNQTAATISPCFIATAAYGTALHGDIDVLRDFRDEYLMPNPAGRAFVEIYYNTSPPLADVIRDNEGLRSAVREGLVKPLVYVTRMFV